MNAYIQTPPINLPNPGLPPEGFPVITPEVGNYTPNYEKKNFLNNILYKLPGIEKKQIILPGKIDPEQEDYKSTLEQIIFH